MNTVESSKHHFIAWDYPFKIGIFQPLYETIFWKILGSEVALAMLIKLQQGKKNLLASFSCLTNWNMSQKHWRQSKYRKQLHVNPEPSPSVGKSRRNYMVVSFVRPSFVFFFESVSLKVEVLPKVEENYAFGTGGTYLQRVEGGPPFFLLCIFFLPYHSSPPFPCTNSQRYILHNYVPK
jgi:hypothetical protein